MSIHDPILRQEEIGTPPAAPAGLAFDPRWQRAAFWFLAITTLLRLCQLSTMELAPDEAYYWDWSRHPALGYYDQGPLIAYLIRATTALFGVNEFGVRIGVLLSSLGTLICAYLLAKRCFSPMAGFLTVFLLGLTPLMEVGSIIATYDPPLVFFWALTVVFLERALFGPGEAPEGTRQRVYWIYAGISTGLGFLSKHTMLLILPCLIGFLLFSPPSRFWLRRKEPYLALLITLLLYSGVFWWNAHHHWWTFGHLLFLTHKSSSGPLRRLGDFLGSQLLLIGPLLFCGLFLGRAAVKPGERRSLFLFWMGWPVFGFFCLLAFKSRVQGNWAAFAWITPAILWAGLLASRASASRAGARVVLRQTAAVGATGLLLTLLMVAPGLRYRIGIHLPPDQDLSNQTSGWHQLADRVQQIRTQMSEGGRRPVFLTGNGYQYCALLAFYLPDHPDTHDLFLHYRLTMYAAYVESLRTKLGEDAIFVNDTQREDADLHLIFQQVTWDPPLTIYRRPYYKEPIHTLHIARCRGFRRYVGTDWHVGG